MIYLAAITNEASEQATPAEIQSSAAKMIMNETLDENSNDEHFRSAISTIARAIYGPNDLPLYFLNASITHSFLLLFSLLLLLLLLLAY